MPRLRHIRPGVSSSIARHRKDLRQGKHRLSMRRGYASAAAMMRVLAEIK